MVLVCPNCSSRFKVKPEALGEKGRLVRCANCSHKWHASVADLEESSPVKAKPAAKAAPPKTAAKKAAPKKSTEPKPTAVEKPVESPEEVAPPPAEPLAPSEPEPDAAEPDFDGEDALAHLDREDEGAAEETPAETSEAEEFDGPPPPIPPASHFEPREPKTSSKGPLIAWLVLFGFVVVFVSCLFFFSKSIVEAYPPASKIFQAVGIDVDILGHGFNLPKPIVESHPDKTPRTIVLKGVVENTTSDTLTIPLLKGSLRDTEGQDISAWVFRASREEALPGESVPYETENSSIPKGATGVGVTFITEEEAHAQGLLDGEGHEQEMMDEEQSH